MMIILAFIIGWAVAQGVKVVRAKKGERLQALLRTGGMPSSHAASFGAAVWYLGLSGGFSSDLFAIALCMYIIVIYDAMNVRHAVGEQGKVLNRILEKIPGLKKPKVVEGHTLLEVAVGALIGVAVGFLLKWLIYS